TTTPTKFFRASRLGPNGSWITEMRQIGDNGRYQQMLGNVGKSVRVNRPLAPRVAAAYHRRESLRGIMGLHLGRREFLKAGGGLALPRRASHNNHTHPPMIYYSLPGHEVERPNEDNDVRPPQRGDHPHLGSVLARFKPAPLGLPGFVAIPELAVRSSTKGEFK